MQDRSQNTYQTNCSHLNFEFYSPATIACRLPTHVNLHHDKQSEDKQSRLLSGQMQYHILIIVIILHFIPIRLLEIIIDWDFSTRSLLFIKQLTSSPS